MIDQTKKFLGVKVTPFPSCHQIARKDWLFAHFKVYIFQDYYIVIVDLAIFLYVKVLKVRINLQCTPSRLVNDI